MNVIKQLKVSLADAGELNKSLVERVAALEARIVAIEEAINQTKAQNAKRPYRRKNTGAD